MAGGQKQYIYVFRNTIVELYNAGKRLAKLSGKCYMQKSTIAGRIKI